MFLMTVIKIVHKNYIGHISFPAYLEFISNKRVFLKKIKFCIFGVLLYTEIYKLMIFSETTRSRVLIQNVFGMQDQLVVLF